MQMNEKERKDLVISKVVLLVLAACGVLVIVWLAWLHPARPQRITSFKECVAAGNPVQESYPETCVTKNGQRFTNPRQSITNVKIPEWGVQFMVQDIPDVYHSYSPEDDTVLVSSRSLDAAAKKVTGCTSGLHGDRYQRVQPGDATSEGEIWELAQLQEQAQKVGDYYYLEYPSIEILCAPDAQDPHVIKVQALRSQLQTAFRNLTAL